MQMRQLFPNPVAHPPKFYPAGVPPAGAGGAAGVARARSSRPPGAPPGVEVVAEVVPDPSGNGTPGMLCRITVRDNGIGFDEKYLDRIFQMFQRLHGRGEYEGTGVGLAICRKIVERHGGAITARSRAGEGAAFVV